MATNFKVDTYDEFLKLAENKDFSIAKAIVDSVLNNLETKKNNIHVFQIEVAEEKVIYDLTIEREGFLDALEKNLNHYEKEELYEECIKIIDAIKFLKTKNNG